MKVTRYTKADAEQWDAFVRASKNGTFLLQRAYMDYHSDRFADHSLIFHDDKGHPVALLPANERDGVLQSHGGLTYGGIICDESMTTPRMLEVFDVLLEHLRTNGLNRLLYKTIPYIYHLNPAEEDRYALFRADARLYRRDVLSVICQDRRLPFQKRRARKVSQAQKLGLVIEASEDLEAFWAILEANLAAVHGVRPVHSVEEMRLLNSRFPDQIRLHVCKENGGIVAGVVVFNATRVAHVQYISSSERGREIGALDLLFATLIERDYADQAYFDFGISNEQEGKVMNVGLIEQKEGFGARAVTHDYYELSVV
ncbi:GNAT family N-acetyltransferase [Paraburkholderia diazotrophica]|uniref:Acetyltransferase (GNAT) domain-containing protein n=1 Tax=Paraburkholderia diazotrophica TaxID=667676 RepID=A0A1H7DSB6_9BURK|nr:GNAT family N-acetyltransferase [Paraburkholderia diazotrophica]SEK02190.1 Acetyltransferase (GNAT) domain-containing protein [Paraburkholderia diazotrophica]